MGKYFTVNIKETLEKTVVIEADSMAEAAERAEGLCNSGEIDLGAEHFTGRTVEALRKATAADEDNCDIFECDDCEEDEQPYLGCTILNIELDRDGSKIAHIMADSYDSEDDTETPYRFMEFCWGYISLEKLIEDGIPDGDWFSELKQSVKDCSLDELIEAYEHFDNGNMPTLLNIDDISNYTPCGCYIITEWI